MFLTVFIFKSLFSGPPHVRPMPSVRAVEGGEIRVTCPVSGYPIQSITWQKGGKRNKKVSFSRICCSENGQLEDGTDSYGGGGGGRRSKLPRPLEREKRSVGRSVEETVPPKRKGEEGEPTFWEKGIAVRLPRGPRKQTQKRERRGFSVSYFTRYGFYYCTTTTPSSSSPSTPVTLRWRHGIDQCKTVIKFRRGGNALAFPLFFEKSTK